MPHLLAEVRWRGGAGRALGPGTKSFDGGRFSVCLHSARGGGVEEEDLFYCAENRVICTVLGYIFNLSELASSYSIGGSSRAEIACGLYLAKGMSFVRELDGIFLICLFDEKAGKAYVLQSRSGFDLPVYYSRGEESLFLSTSLRKMLRHSAATREIDLTAARDCLHWHALVPSKATLVKHVSKLTPETYLVVDCGSRSVELNECEIGAEPGLSRTQAKQRIIPEIELYLGRLLVELGDRRIALTLTSGWDSNIVLHLLRRMTDAPIDAITIDGGGAASEVAAVRAILENYSGIRHVTRKVPKDLRHLADLVWRYEGAVFNEGMSLRYELGNALREVDADRVVLGSGADQVIWPQSTMRSVLRCARKAARRIAGRESMESRARRNVKRGYKATLRDIQLDLNLKLHGIPLNSFGVRCFYPFVNARMMEIGSAMGLFYNWRKRAYIDEVKRVLPPGVSRHLRKSGNVVDTAAGFSANRDLITRALTSELAGTLLGRSEIERIAARPDDHHLLIMQLAYLNAFNKLFISGNYDSHFEDERLDLPPSELL